MSAQTVLSAKEYRKLSCKDSKSPAISIKNVRSGRLAAKRSVGSGTDPRSLLERQFMLWWNGLNGPNLVSNLSFHPTRKFRFDFAHCQTKTAIEIEGGSWVRGAHNRGKHFASDCEKYNAATMLGWRVFRLTAEMITVPALESLIAFIQEPGQFVK